MSKLGRLAVGTLGIGMICAALAGRAALFVRPWFVPVILAAGVLLLIVAWIGRARIGVAGAALLMVPLIVGIGISPETATRVGAVSSQATELVARFGDGSNPLLDGGGEHVTLLDVALADREVGSVSLDGRRVIVEGVISTGGMLSRLAMVCCAADARPVGIAVRGALPPVGSWARVDGLLSSDQGTLVLVADRVESIPAPDQPFL